MANAEDMRKRYEGISLADLKGMAKFRGIKCTSTMKKADYVEAMLAKDEEENKATEKAAPAPAKEEVKAAPAKEEAKAAPKAAEDDKGDKGERKKAFDVDALDEQQIKELDSGQTVSGILEVMQDGFGFIRCENFLPGVNDVYVAPGQIRRFALKTGDILTGNTKIKTEKEKFRALLYLTSVNGYAPETTPSRLNFEEMTPVFPNKKIKLERPGAPVSMRIMDLISPIGKGQRGMIVAQPKAGKTTLLKDVAKSIKYANPDMHMIILLIDERPEEVTDMKEEVGGDGVEVIYSTFDETPEHHKRTCKTPCGIQKGRYHPAGFHHPSDQSLQPGGSAQRTYAFRRSGSRGDASAQEIFRCGT